MPAMPRPPYLYLHRYLTRHGKTIWYVRKPGRNRIRLKEPYGSPAFWEAYQTAIDGTLSQASAKAAKGSLAWLWAGYCESGAFTGLSKATQRQRRNIMKGVLAKIGHEPLTVLNRKSIIASREARAKTPAQARNFLDAVRGLYRWALEADHIKADPTAGIKNPERKAGPGFLVWTEDEIDAYHRRWPIGTKERVWMDVLLYTGLRRGDAFRFGKQHISKDGLMTFYTEKSEGETVPAHMVILPEFWTTMAAGPCGDMTFIVNSYGRPFTRKESFGNAFSKAARAAGVAKSAHGIRKADATRAAEAGATNSQMMAMFAWTDPKMPALYTQKAERKHMARAAGDALKRRPGTRAVLTSIKSKHNT